MAQFHLILKQEVCRWKSRFVILCFDHKRRREKNVRMFHVPFLYLTVSLKIHSKNLKCWKFSHSVRILGGILLKECMSQCGMTLALLLFTNLTENLPTSPSLIPPQSIFNFVSRLRWTEGESRNFLPFYFFNISCTFWF